MYKYKKKLFFRLDVLTHDTLIPFQMPVAASPFVRRKLAVCLPVHPKIPIVDDDDDDDDDEDDEDVGKARPAVPRGNRAEEVVATSETKSAGPRPGPAGGSKVKSEVGEEGVIDDGQAGAWRREATAPAASRGGVAAAAAERRSSFRGRHHQPFVRSYRTAGGGGGGSTADSAKGGGGTAPYRMSMAIRPQTVANLASKFDTLVKNSGGGGGAATAGGETGKKSSGGKQIKLRTYDITKIISELNRLNDDPCATSSSSSTTKAQQPGGDEKTSKKTQEKAERRRGGGEESRRREADEKKEREEEEKEEDGTVTAGDYRYYTCGCLAHTYVRISASLLTAGVILVDAVLKLPHSRLPNVRIGVRLYVRHATNVGFMNHFRNSFLVSPFSFDSLLSLSHESINTYGVLFSCRHCTSKFALMR